MTTAVRIRWQAGPSLCRCFERRSIRTYATTTSIDPSSSSAPSTPSTAAGNSKTRWTRLHKNAGQADVVQVHVKGGHGGAGCISFARDMFKPYGPPSGGPGGQGGSVLLQVDPSVASLARVTARSVAHNGEGGSSDWQVGKAGEDRIIRVPIGTVIRVVPIGPEAEDDQRRQEYADLLRRQYRKVFLRRRKIRSDDLPLPTSSIEMDDVTPEQAREYRNLTWRRYAGLVGHHVPDKDRPKSRKQKKEEYKEWKAKVKAGEIDPDEEYEADVEAEAEEEVAPDGENGHWSLANQAVEEDLTDANSDIRELGRSFNEAELRLAFRLLDQDLARHRERDKRRMEPTQETEEEELDDDAATTTVPGEWTFDITEEMAQPMLLAEGGHGGLGNAFFASSSTNRSPTLATHGHAGQEAIVHLEWKFKGDVGLIGLPNAGKSTFLKSVCATSEHVRVASYAFTTITPNIGVVRFGQQGLLGIRDPTAPIEESIRTPKVIGQHTPEEAATTSVPTTSPSIRRRDHEEETSRFILQDLPGLVRGASENRGLGHDFLRHVERCHALYYVVDVSHTAAEPWNDVQLVFNELEQYRAGLGDKVQGVLANKCDAMQALEGEVNSTSSIHAASPSISGEALAEAKQKLQRLRHEVQRIHGRPVPVWNVSAKHRQGVERVARSMDRTVQDIRHRLRQQQEAEAAKAVSLS